MDGQQRIGVPAVEAVNVQMIWEFPTGWYVTAIARRSGQAWADASRDTYEYLTTDELADVLDAVAVKYLRG